MVTKNQIKLVTSLHQKKYRSKHNFQWGYMMKHIEFLLNDPDKVRSKKNREFVEHELSKYKKHFDTENLTRSQRIAVVTNEESNLIVAGAGSGKTKVMVSRISYILKKGFTTPDKILVLAFAKNAANELQERINKTLNIDLKIRTFHALGYEIIGSATNDKPAILGSSADTLSKTRLIRNVFNKLMMSSSQWSAFMNYFSNYLKPYKDEFSFKNIKSYEQYTRNTEYRSINGVLVKSKGEMCIANYFYLNNIQAN